MIRRGLEVAKEMDAWDDPIRANYLETGVLKEWVESDHEKAIEWINDQARGEHRDWLSSEVVDLQLGRDFKDYAELFGLLGGMENEEHQEGMAGKVLRNSGLGSEVGKGETD